MTRRRDHDDDVPAEDFGRRSSADWPDPAPDPDTEPGHPEHTPRVTEGPYG